MRGAGLCVNENYFYLDHMGIICSIMDVPVLALEDPYLELGKKYYPDITVKKLEYDELTQPYLFENFDVIYLSEYWKEKNQLRIVHCPHGFSDKSYWFDKCAGEDIVLVYGRHMLDMFKRLNVKLNQYVITGNYRYTYYKKHKVFYDAIIQNEIAFKKKQPVILYAPTWLDDRNSSTFFEACAHLIENLPPHYNMIVKLHPGLERNDIATYYSIINTYEHLENVRFISEFPPVFPILAMADIFIGDSSSVGYDFLLMNKPMFFLNKFKEDPQTTPYIYLYRCGRNIYPEEYANTYNIIDKELKEDRYSAIRKQVCDYTFGEERTFEEIRRDIRSCLDSSAE